MSGVLVHEWIATHGGSENVFDRFVDAFPDADIRCLWNDTRGDRYPGRRIQESWLASTPLRNHKAIAVPFMLNAWRNLPNAEYDWALISSHLFAHHASFRGAAPDFRKIVYVHTPARYIWTPELDARGNNGIARLLAPALKSVDYKRAKESTTILANSEYVRSRVMRFWDCEAKVIHPPVDVGFIQSVANWRDRLDAKEEGAFEALPEGYVLGASRFVRYKRLDLVIAAAERARLPVVIAGSGRLEAELRAQAALATVPVHFVIEPSNAMLYALYQHASVFVFPPVEDFGIMPVEAIALGTPVVVNATGGAKESAELTGGGAVFLVADAAHIADAIKDAGGLGGPKTAVRTMEFSHANFARKIVSAVDPSFSTPKITSSSRLFDTSVDRNDQ